MEDATFIISTSYDGKPRKLFSRICLICTQEFWAPKHQTRKYCSRTCSDRGRTQRFELTCYACGKSFERTPSHSKTRHGFVFCSRKCKDSAQALTGCCQAIRPEHYGKGNGKYTYRDMLQSSCVACNESRTFILVVHHIDGNRENNDVSNLETVCPTHHALRHLVQDEHGEWSYNPSKLTPRELLRAFDVTVA